MTNVCCRTQRGEFRWWSHATPGAGFIQLREDSDRKISNIAEHTGNAPDIYKFSLEFSTIKSVLRNSIKEFP